MSIQVHMPNLCVKCGKNPPSMTYTLQQKRTDFSPVSVLTIFLGRVVIESQSITLQVPLCETCKRAVAARRRFKLIVIALGMLLVAGGIIWVLIGRIALATTPIPTDAEAMIQYRQLNQDLNLQVWLAGLPISIGLLIAMIGNMIGSPRFVSTDGSIFRFHNKKFQEAFAELNPDLVKRKRG